MNEVIENFWEEYYAERCSLVDTEEERYSINKISKLHDKVNALLTQDQKDAMEQYVEALYENQGICVKKAFFKGCEFAVSFVAITKHI